MKTKLYFCALVVSCLCAFTACNRGGPENPVDAGSSLSKSTQDSGIEAMVGELNDLKPAVEKIARFVATNEARLSPEVRNRLLEQTAVLSKLFKNSGFPATVKDAEGTPYEFGIEISEKSTLNDEPLRVAIDPDRFYPDNDKYPAYVLNAATGEVAIEEVSGTRDLLPYPLAFVTIEDRGEISLNEVKRNSRIFKEEGLQAGPALGKNAAASSGGRYLAIKQVHLNIELDRRTKEEFEVYIREGSGFGDPVFKNTIHKFDGKTRQDAANMPAYYPDVNSKNKTYSMDVRLWPLSKVTPISLAMIEDDCGGGKYAAGVKKSGEVTVRYYQEYRHSTGAIATNVDRKHQTYGGCRLDPDDIYKRGMFSEFTYDNAPKPKTPKKIPLDDLWVTLARWEYQPPPPPPPAAPSIAGSASGTNPKISWSAVSGATGYKVYKAVGASGSPYSKIATISSTYYVDTTETIYNSGAKAHVYYKVKATNSSGPSGYSNIVQFTVNAQPW